MEAEAQLQHQAEVEAEAQKTRRDQQLARQQQTALQVAQSQAEALRNQDGSQRHEREKDDSASKSVESSSAAQSSSSKKSQGPESDAQKRLQTPQQQRRSESASSSGRSQHTAKSRHAPKTDETQNDGVINENPDDKGPGKCSQCGYLMTGSADTSCPICSSEQPDLVYRVLTQYRQAGQSWITSADTLAATEMARQALDYGTEKTAELKFIPKIPRFSQMVQVAQGKRA